MEIHDIVLDKMFSSIIENKKLILTRWLLDAIKEAHL